MHCLLSRLPRSGSICSCGSQDSQLNFNRRRDYDDDRDEDEVVTWCVTEKFRKRRRNDTESSREEWRRLRLRRSGDQLLDVQTKQRRKGIAGIEEGELENPKLLAEPGSCFCEYRGLEIHHKVYEGLSQAHETEAPSCQIKNVGFPMILLHGFGASVFSFNRVMKPLAEATGPKVLAFDRPAFGLTSRVSTFGHSSSGNGESKPLNPHSASCLVAVESYFEAPERVASIILIAPAILAPCAIGNVVEGNESGDDNQTQEDDSKSVNPGISNYPVFQNVVQGYSDVILRMVKGVASMFNSMYKKLLLAILRSTFSPMLVRKVIDKSGLLVLRMRGV